MLHFRFHVGRFNSELLHASAVGVDQSDHAQACLGCAFVTLALFMCTHQRSLSCTTYSCNVTCVVLFCAFLGTILRSSVLSSSLKLVSFRVALSIKPRLRHASNTSQPIPWRIDVAKLHSIYGHLHTYRCGVLSKLFVGR